MLMIFFLGELLTTQAGSLSLKAFARSSRFKWGDWEEGSFTQCGVNVEQTAEGGKPLNPNTLMA